MNPFGMWTDEDLYDVLNDPDATPGIRLAVEREIERREN